MNIHEDNIGIYQKALSELTWPLVCQNKRSFRGVCYHYLEDGHLSTTSKMINFKPNTKFTLLHVGLVQDEDEEVATLFCRLRFETLGEMTVSATTLATVLGISRMTKLSSDLHAIVPSTGRKEMKDTYGENAGEFS